jgi:hypothetical protein
LETLHVILTWIFLYDLTVTGYGDRPTLNTMPWPVGTFLIVSATAGSSVQVCMGLCPSVFALIDYPQAVFAFRLQAITGNFWLALPAYFNQVLRLATAIAAAVMSFRLNDVDAFRHATTVTLCLSLIPSALVSRVYDAAVTSHHKHAQSDAYVAGLLWYYLHTRDIPFPSSVMTHIASYDLHADMDPQHGSHLASLYAIFDRCVSWKCTIHC